MLDIHVVYKNVIVYKIVSILVYIIRHTSALYLGIHGKNHIRMPA